MGMFVNESNFMNKLVLQPKIRKINKQQGVSINGGNKGIAELIRNHYNPGLRQIINTSKSIDELQYIRKDTRTIFPTLEKIRDRIKLCKSEGETSKTSPYYKYIKTYYIDKGITEKDVQKTIDELKKDMETISKRIKELKKIQNESFDLFYEDMDLLEAVELEALFKKKTTSPPTKDDFNFTVSTAKKLLNNYNSIRSIITFEKYKIEDEDSSILYFLDYDTSKSKLSEDEFLEIFDKFIYDIEKEIKHLKLKITVDGDEDNGSAYIEKK